MIATLTPLPFPELIAFQADSRALAIVFAKSGRATCAAEMNFVTRPELMRRREPHRKA